MAMKQTSNDFRGFYWQFLQQNNIVSRPNTQNNKQKGSNSFEETSITVIPKLHKGITSIKRKFTGYFHTWTWMKRKKFLKSK